MEKPNVLPEEKDLWLVSSCLVGLKTRYDCQKKTNEHCVEFLADKYWIPVCPEQLGGLSTPRVPAVIEGGDGDDVLAGVARVLTTEGEDVTDAFIHGARQVLEIYRGQNIRGMCVKARSPSCGCLEIRGVTSALLQQEEILLKEF